MSMFVDVRRLIANMSGFIFLQLINVGTVVRCGLKEGQLWSMPGGWDPV